MLSAALILAAAVGQSPQAVTVTKPAVFGIAGVRVENPTRDRMHVVLTAVAELPSVAAATRQRLLIGDGVVPLEGPPRVVTEVRVSRVSFDVQLREVPEGVLAFEPSHVPVRWEALSPERKPVVALEGVLDLWDRERVELSAERLSNLYARLASYSVAPRGVSVGVRVLLSLYNPFAFEVVATSLAYKLTIGTQVVLDSRRAGFRLRPCQDSDVRLEEEVGLGEAAGGLAAYLRNERAVVDGLVVIRTPKGDKSVPLHLEAGT